MLGRSLNSVQKLQSIRAFTNATKSFTLPDLAYDYGALAPVISADIMELHHKKHHQTYVNNLNMSLEKYAKAEAAGNVAEMIALQSAIKFNGGGHVNHSIFWTNLAPKNQDGGVAPSGPLMDAINKNYGSIDNLIKTMTDKTVAIQGSGWGWLGYDKAQDRLVISTQQNQDPLSMSGLTPLLGIDVWEHAYYLDYKNVRADYVKKIWEIVNWKNVAQRYEAAKKN